LVDHLEVIAIFGLALLLVSVIAAIVERIRRRRRGLRMPPAKAWWIAPSAATVALVTSTVILGVQEPEVGIFWGLAWVAWMPLVWGSALAARLAWHFLRRRASPGEGSPR